MNRTGIEWARLGLETGFTFNPIVGCTNGCQYCYAKVMAS